MLALGWTAAGGITGLGLCTPAAPAWGLGGKRAGGRMAAPVYLLGGLALAAASSMLSSWSLVCHENRSIRFNK